MIGRVLFLEIVAPQLLTRLVGSLLQNKIHFHHIVPLQSELESCYSLLVTTQKQQDGVALEKATLFEFDVCNW